MYRQAIGSEIQPWLGVWRPSSVSPGDWAVQLRFYGVRQQIITWLVQHALELKVIGARSKLSMPFPRN